jgi:hypothetical protein
MSSDRDRDQVTPQDDSSKIGAVADSDSSGNQYNPNMLDIVQEFMESHWVEIRMGCIWGSALLFIAFIRSSSAFKRYNTLHSLATLNDLTNRKFAVFIAHVERDPVTAELYLHAFHTPWLRSLFGLHPSKLSLEKHTWKIRLVGVTFPQAEAASDIALFNRFLRKKFILRFVDDAPANAVFGVCQLYRSHVSHGCDFVS